MSVSTPDIWTLLKSLITCKSITPQDAHCQDVMIDFLKPLGFRCQRFDNPPVANFYAEYGEGGSLLIFAGHTDVVPEGDRKAWQYDPFDLTEIDGMLYGRGVADMKGSLAAMLIAAQQWVTNTKHTNGRLGFLITSGEEGDDYNLGTPYVMTQLHKQGVKANYCIVGEPSSSKRVGDVIKIGRRGSLTGKLQLQGKQGHVAYPHLAQNPIHKIAPALAELSNITWDQGNAHFPPTSLQITHIHSGGQANNIIPQDITVHFNIRYSTEHTAESLQQIIEDCFAKHQLQPTIQWTLNGRPFLTDKGRLLVACEKVILNHTLLAPELSTSGGTSDGRFIAPYGVEVVELGPVNQTIHQINECVAHEDLKILSDLYYGIILELLS